MGADTVARFPVVSNALRFERLEPPAGRVRVVIDTDTYNEIDDQFAIVYALLSAERLKVEALYAAPFFNDNAKSPGDGMEKSHEEILRLLARLEVSPQGFVFRGSKDFLASGEQPLRSEAAEDLVARAMAADAPLYVVAIGAITNVAAALLLEPRIIERIVVVWLAGHALHWPHAREFNLKQDLHASKLVLDCGVPLVLIPCLGVASHLLTTGAEIERHVRGKGAIGDYLAEIFRDYQARRSHLSKVLWDIAPVAYLLNDRWVASEVRHSPVLTGGVTWSVDCSRHFVRIASFVEREPVFRDFFKKLSVHAASP
jgi:inosine-uridine nucleoside N-ribohydrolase